MTFLLALLLAYLIGSLPSHFWVLSRSAYRFRLPLLTSLTKREAFLLIVIDLVKGMSATLIGFALAGWFAAYLAAIVVVVGSMYSVFLGFRGGNGLGVAAGALLILSPVLILIGILIYLLSLLTTRILFLSTLLTTVAMILFGVVLATHFAVWLVILILGLLILSRMRPRWKRMRRGFEPPYRFKNPFR
jgi:acyl-phosphate glycerol 3-phosphate acyltransferase